MEVCNMLIKGSDKYNRMKTGLTFFSIIFLWKFSKNYVVNTYTYQTDSTIKVFLCLLCSIVSIYPSFSTSINSSYFFDAFQSKSQIFASNYLSIPIINQLCLNQHCIVLHEHNNYSFHWHLLMSPKFHAPEGRLRTRCFRVIKTPPM